MKWRIIIKRGVKVTIIVIIVVAAVVIFGGLLFRHFVTDRITDKGGMENPEYTQEQ